MLCDEICPDVEHCPICHGSYDDDGDCLITVEIIGHGTVDICGPAAIDLHERGIISQADLDRFARSCINRKRRGTKNYP